MSNRIWHRTTLLVVLVASAAFAAAQQHIFVPRADGHTTPLMIYPAVSGGAGCKPLAIIDRKSVV